MLYISLKKAQNNLQSNLCWTICVQKRHKEPDMEQQTGKIGKIQNWERNTTRLYIVTLLI